MTVPQVPAPQTCFGVLNENGLPSEMENITDLPPDFGWMSSIQIHVKTFVIKQDSMQTFPKFYPLFRDLSMESNYPIACSSDLKYATWHHLIMSTGKYWCGSVSLRFMALKPPRVPGKLIVRWNPDVTATTENGDRALRGIKKEWDLAQSCDFEFDIPGFNVIQKRPTWLPRFVPADYDKDSHPRYMGWIYPIPSWTLGSVSLKVSQPIIPGNIFPSSFRILVFASFKDFALHTQCDPRSELLHIFGEADVRDYNVFTPTAIPP